MSPWENPPRPQIQADLLTRIATAMPGSVGVDGTVYADVWLKLVQRHASVQLLLLQAEFRPVVDGLNQRIEMVVESYREEMECVKLRQKDCNKLRPMVANLKARNDSVRKERHERGERAIGRAVARSVWEKKNAGRGKR
ncbi:hypothetical protein KKE60_06445 [Patescibacteria group bacterium]|nr:hypothetical protein [Patescibacteria group bacterium]